MREKTVTFSDDSILDPENGLCSSEMSAVNKHSLETENMGRWLRKRCQGFYAAFVTDNK